MTKIPFILLFLFFIPLVSSLEIGISPPKLELNISVDQEICRPFRLITDRQTTFTIETKWSEELSRNLKDYTLPEENLELRTNAHTSIPVSSSQPYMFCINAKEAGTYYGVIIASAPQGAAVGSWLTITVSDKQESVSSKITGLVTKDNASSSISYSILPIVLLEFTLLFASAGMLLLVVSRKKKANLV